MIHVDPRPASEKLISFIKETFHATKFTDAVIAVSGGVDSAVSCRLAVAALGHSHIYPLMLPYGALNTQGVLDAMNFIDSLHIPVNNISRVDIKPIVDQLTKSDSTTDNIRRGNIMARVRMTILFDQAKKHKALVVGTENKTEHLLGYFTRFGDEASDIEPLRNLYKTQVYELATFLGVADSILKQAPTAGLWFDQTDEGEFGFSYKEADAILIELVDGKKTPEDVIRLGYDKAVVEKVYNRMKNNDFKHHLPILP